MASRMSQPLSVRNIRAARRRALGGSVGTCAPKNRSRVTLHSLRLAGFLANRYPARLRPGHPGCAPTNDENVAKNSPMILSADRVRLSAVNSGSTHGDFGGGGCGHDWSL